MKTDLPPALQRQRANRPPAHGLLLCMLLPCWVQAQPLPVAASADVAVAAAAPPAVLRLRSFVVTGDNPLDEATTSQSLAPLLRAPVSLESLQQAVAALEAALSARGYALHRVVLPAQEVGDTLRLQVVRFAMGQVQLQGPPGLDEAAIRRALPELQEGQTPRFDRLAVQTALANENPARQLQVALKASDTEPDQIDATVRVQTRAPVQGAVNLSNTGNAASGRDRVSISLLHANLTGHDDQLGLAWTTSLARWDDVRQLGLSYRLPLYAQGAMLDVSWSDSTVLGQFGSFTSTGAGHTAALQFTQHHTPQAGWSRASSLSLENKVFVPSAISPVGGGPVVLLSQRRLSRPLTLGLKLRHQDSSAYADVSLSLATSLPGGSGNTLSAYQSENTRINSTRWTALRGQFNHLRPFGGWLLSTRVQGQWACTSLMAAEQFGLGGASSLRGVGERVLAADSGVGAGLEISSPALTEGLRAVAFTDAGWLRQRRLGQDAKPLNDTVVSLGLGLRYSHGPMSLVLDHARVVNGSLYAPAAAQAGQSRWHLLLNARF